MSLVVGENLRQLSEHYKICAVSSFDEYSLKLNLSPNIFVPKVVEGELDYANSEGSEFYEEASIPDSGILLKPNDCILACSAERVKIPLGFFGMVQTKGSLARIFVSVHQTDCQIEPGFEGSITFEIKNHSPHSVRLRKYDNVAQLFIWTCSTDNTIPYDGKYCGSERPTLKRVRK